MEFLKARSGMLSSTRLVSLLSWLTILGLLIYVTIRGDNTKSEILFKFSALILPTISATKVIQYAEEVKGSNV